MKWIRACDVRAAGYYVMWSKDASASDPPVIINVWIAPDGCTYDVNVEMTAHTPLFHEVYVDEMFLGPLIHPMDVHPDPFF